MKKIIVTFAMLSILSCEQKHKNYDSEETRETVEYLTENKETTELLKDIKIPDNEENKQTQNLDWNFMDKKSPEEREEWKKKATEYLQSKGENVPDYNPPTTNSNTNNNINDFEYSENWRQMAYKTTKTFMIQKLKNQLPKCNMISQGSYHPNLVEFVGGQTFLVRIRSKFDCNQSYTNEIVSLVYATYDGNNHWTMNMVETNLTH